MTKIRIDLLENTSKVALNEDGSFNKQEAIRFSGREAGICYDKEGYNHIAQEPVEKTDNRVSLTLGNGHHSVNDHVQLGLNLQNVPKILAMVLNNEHQYTTSEKSARYTPVVREDESSFISLKEEELYNKWLNIFELKIKDVYGYVFDDRKIHKLAQENARYLVTVFMPTQMGYTTSFRQMNYIASWMEKYISEANKNSLFETRLSASMREFIDELDRLGILEERLMRNEKHRSLSIFGKDLDANPDIFANVYSTVYTGSFAQYAQAHRHRTLDYQLEFLEETKFFIPPIIADDNALVSEWLNDMKAVSEYTPQGQLVRIIEMGTYDNFILKCKERLCSAAQLEIMRQTRETLMKYKDALEKSNNHLLFDIQKYTKGARCTFPDFDCSQSCGFAEGINLTRKI